MTDSCCGFKEPGLYICPMQYKLCVVYSVGVLHRVGTHPWHIREKFWRLHVLAIHRFSSFIISGPSNITTSTLGMMSYCSSVASSRRRTMSDMVSSLRLPLYDMMVGMVGTRERNIH